MRDFDVRASLRRTLSARFANDPQTRIIEELGICQGSVRIDIAVANCSLHGYEIKSAADTLERLPAQAEGYSRVFDYVTLVTASCHLENTIQLIPGWWGVTAAAEQGGEIYLEAVRPAEHNPFVDSYAVAQLLWREEALDLLEKIGHAKGVRSKPREHVWSRLAQVTSSDLLRQHVRDRLKSREYWRVAAPQA
jgi:hypothetical protein